MEQFERISQRIKLPHLRVLVAVAQTGSMAKAAKNLAISQSVVSKSIAESESTLGVPLFDRSAKGVEPTLYGNALLKRSVALFDDLRTGVGEVKFLADHSVGELRIGTSEPQAGLVAAVIELLARRHPGIAFKIMQGDARTLVRELGERRVELAVAPLPSAIVDEGLEATVLYHNRFRVVVGQRSLWVRRRKVTLANLINEPWCGPFDGPAGPLIAGAFRAAGLPMPRMTVSTIANHLVTRMLMDGRFVGILSDGVVYFDPNRASLKVLPVELQAGPLPIAVITLKCRTVSPVARLFIDCAREVARPLAQTR